MVGFRDLVGTDIAPVSKKTAVKYVPANSTPVPTIKSIILTILPNVRVLSFDTKCYETLSHSTNNGGFQLFKS